MGTQTVLYASQGLSVLRDTTYVDHVIVLNFIKQQTKTLDYGSASYEKRNELLKLLTEMNILEAKINEMIVDLLSD